MTASTRRAALGAILAARQIILAWLAHRDLRRAKALLQRSDRRFAASGLFRLPVTASGVPHVNRA